MTKAELVDRISTEADVTKADAEKALKALLTPLQRLSKTETV